MKSKIVIITLFLSLFGSSVFAQKVKYKDLIVLLEAKQFERAEPFLRKYLKEDSDNPSAYLYMGMTLQEKAIANDILKNTDILLSNCDSSVLFFDKAYNAITEKELKRNDEYYQMYSRRDLRTGEFGIKLSDVRLDLETRVKNLKDRKDKVRELKKYFIDAEKLYTKANSSFKNIQSKYESESAFYLQSDDELVAQLNRLSSTFDSTITAFNSFSSVLKQLSKPGYNQQINLQEIVDLKRDGSSGADFYSDDLRLWDYKRWAKSSIDAIQNVINPLRDRLISYDISLNKLHQRIKKDSVSVLAELAQFEDGLLYGQLKKYDTNPLPIEVFEMKKAEMTYISSTLLHKPARDSSNVMQKLVYLNQELKYIDVLDSITSKLSLRDLSKDSEKYKLFITKAYGTQQVLASYISSTLEYAKREKLHKQVQWEATIQATKWIISGGDSIPLFLEQTSKELNFKPLQVVDEKYTVGIHLQDTIATGYLYSITPSRIADVASRFPLDRTVFTKRNLPVIKSLATADVSNSVYFALIYSESKVAEKFVAIVSKIMKTGGLTWSVNIKLDIAPSELSYSSETQELSIKLSNGSESRLVIIDKDGKQLQ
jgi:phage anti-repressor protein